MRGGTCPLCPLEPWDDSLGVQNFPRKPVKKAPRAERTLTCVVVRPGEQDDQEFLLTQRPNKGESEVTPAAGFLGVEPDSSTLLDLQTLFSWWMGIPQD